MRKVTYFVASLGVMLFGLTSFSAQAEAPNWSGPYAGLSGGYLSSQSKWSNQSNTGTESGIFGFEPYNQSFYYAPDSTGSQTFNSSGAQIGVFGGYNWQIDKYIIGLEGDFSWANNSSSKNFIPGLSGNCTGGYSCSGDSTSVKLGWNASLRPRFGYLLTPDTLLYGTAGLAVQSVKISQTCQFSNTDPACQNMPTSPSSTATNNYTALGYALGAGVEKMIDAWVIRAEYRYNQYNNINVSSLLSSPTINTKTVTTTSNSNVRISTQLINLGVAYRF